MKPPTPGLMPGLSTVAMDLWLLGLGALVVIGITVAGWVRRQVGEFADLFRSALAAEEEAASATEEPVVADPETTTPQTQRAEPYPGFDWGVYERI